jgi:amidophosphoribosyltransferase
VAWPCFFGIDFASRAELMAGRLGIDEIRASIGADSLGFVSLDGLIKSTTLPAGRLCRACFDGEYPMHVADDEKGKHLLEDVVSAVGPTAGVAAGSAAGTIAGWRAGEP